MGDTAVLVHLLSVSQEQNLITYRFSPVKWEYTFTQCLINVRFIAVRYVEDYQ